MPSLYDLTQAAKHQDQQAISEIICIFEPKIRKLSRFTPTPEKEDLEQELKIEIVKAVNRFEAEAPHGFWELVDENSL